MKITYRERHYIGDYKAIDTYKTITLYRTWKSRNLLYGYKDRYNVVVVALEDIKTIEE